MMKFKICFLLTVVCLIASSCRKDEFDSNEATITTDPIERILSSVQGIVVDENEKAISNVSITAFAETFSTDKNGFFKMEDVAVRDDGSMMKFSKSGFFDNFKFVQPRTGTTSFVKVMMVQEELAGKLDASTGGPVDFDNGAKVSFPANGFVDQSGNAYSGEVVINAHWYNPEDSDIVETMPGDLRGIDASSQFVQLQTFGMMAVELYSSAGAPLDLAPNALATLTFPISNNLASDAPQEIPLWSLDEDTGYWKEEGTAKLENGAYIGEVSHFSFWNCDAPFPLIKLSGTFLDQDGNPISYANVCITVTTTGLAGYGYTDSKGGFCGKVPADKTLSIQLKDECGNIIFEDVIGPYSEDEDLGELTANLPNGNFIFGTLECDGVVVSNGYVIITYDDGSYTIIEADQNGYFEGYLLNCNSLKFLIKGYDVTNTREGDEQMVTAIQNQDVNMGMISICDDLDYYIKYTIKENGVDGDEQLYINDPSVTVINDSLIISMNTPTGDRFLLTVADVLALGTYIPSFFLVDGPFSNNQYFQLTCDLFNSSTNIDCSDKMTVEITEFENGVIGGTFEATDLTDIFANGPIANICGEFRLMIDMQGSSGSICGKVWNDENEDGLRQDTENLLPNIQFFLADAAQNIQDISVTTDSDGNFKFVDLLEGTYYLYGTADTIEATLLQVGSDNTIDNDFNNINVGNIPAVLAGPLTVIGGQTLENVDLGTINRDASTMLECNTDLQVYEICPGNSAFVTIQISGGLQPYQIDGIPVNPVASVEVFNAGTYTYIIEDASGQQCAVTIDVFYVDAQPAEVETIDGDCGQGNGSLEVVNVQNYSSILWYDATGNTLVSDEALASNLAPGYYSLEAYDFNDCFFSALYEIKYQGANVGDFVWYDELPGGNGTDGVQDPDEVGLDNVYLSLYNDVGERIDTTSTDSKGYYSFEDIPEGLYYIQVDSFPSNLAITDLNVGSDIKLDNDVDPITLKTTFFEVEECIDNNTIDIGFKEQ